MLVSWVVELEAESNGRIPVTHGEAMQSEFFRRLSEIHPELASSVHGKAEGAKRDYTLSPLWCPGKPLAGEIPVRAGDRCWFRVTAFGGEAVEAIDALADLTRSWVVWAGRHEVPFSILGWRDHGCPWSGRRLLYDLDHQVPDADRATFQFLTPTAFSRSKARAHWGESLPLPLPELIFGGLWRNFVRVFPQTRSVLAEPDSLRKLTALGRFNVHSDMMEFGRRGRRQPGFVGQAEVLFHPHLGTEDRQFLNLLAEFAFFAGVGTGTSWGMGQVRRLRPREFGDF